MVARTEARQPEQLAIVDPIWGSLLHEARSAAAQAGEIEGALHRAEAKAVVAMLEQPAPKGEPEQREHQDGAHGQLPDSSRAYVNLHHFLPAYRSLVPCGNSLPRGGISRRPQL